MYLLSLTVTDENNLIVLRSFGIRLDIPDGIVQMMQFQPHLRYQVLHSSYGINNFNTLRVGVVAHFNRPRQGVSDPTPATMVKTAIMHALKCDAMP